MVIMEYALLNKEELFGYYYCSIDIGRYAQGCEMQIQRSFQYVQLNCLEALVLHYFPLPL